MKRPVLSSIAILAALLLHTPESRAAEMEPYGNGVLYRIDGRDPPEARLVCMTASGTITSRGRLIVNKRLRPNGYCTQAGFVVVPWVEWAEPVAGHHTITFTAVSQATGAVMAQLTVSLFLNATSLPSAALHVRAGLGSDAPAPAGGIALPATARVALGSVVTFEAVTSEGHTAPARFSLVDVSVDEGVAAGALFPDQVLIAYNSNVLHRRSFQAVHRGRVTIKVEPDDTAIDAGTVTVIVENPAALGTANNDVDAALFEVAHRWGAPPQFIKAHARKEAGSGFSPLSYRYEPIGPYADLLAVSRGQNLRVKAPYERYRLATARDTLNDALSQGRDVTSADRDVRNGLVIGCDADGTGGHAISAADAEVSAWEIFRCNDARMNWKKRAGSRGAARAKALEKDLFTAQTSLAASYGLLQMTYVTAIDRKWRTADGAHNPSLLFDTEENLKRGGGSLSVGTMMVVRSILRAMARGKVQPPLAAEDLLELFQSGWNEYNEGEARYEADVAGFVPLYAPVATGPVLGGEL